MTEKSRVCNIFSQFFNNEYMFSFLRLPKYRKRFIYYW